MTLYYPKLIIFILLISISFSCKEVESGIGNSENNQISLAGEWRVSLDSLNVGERDGWATEPAGAVSIELPGTLDDAGIGKKSTLEPALNNYVLSNLNRKHSYYGKAWYQKQIDIPESWKGKDIALRLERVLWESTVFVDGKSIGSRESVIGSHDYDLTDVLTPGEHTLSIRIDNSDKYPYINVIGDRYPAKEDKEMAHAYTNHTQIKWNGILGDILLQATAKGSPRNLQIYPDFSNETIRVTFESSTDSINSLDFKILDGNGNSVYQQKVVNPTLSDTLNQFSISRPKDLKNWDEFTPNVYTAELTLNDQSVSTDFGWRDVTNTNAELKLNGQRIFLRGDLECVIFPLTGHPPMKKEVWAKLYAQAKDYGINHLRFHSWAPPKEAFEAADEAGIYLQVELPHWSLKVGEDQKTTNFLYSEARKILKDYGNHPSFIMMSMGNELQGDIGVLNKMTAYLKARDDRHLYTTTTFSFQRPTGTIPEPEDEFFVAQWTDKGWIRGQGIFNDQPPSFDADYSENMKHIELPVISHEIGQYSVYPDLSEIDKYTGVLQPLNFIAVKNDLEKKGMLNLAPEFTEASGKLAALLYKEEIERALKTKEFDGFQLLQLQDFPGQGTALVGLLNVFWESKGVITGEEFRKFNSEMVPLIRFPKAVYKAGETFDAKIEIADFYKPMENQGISWYISNSDGKVLKDGKFTTNLKVGNNNDLGDINYSLESQKAEKISVTVKVDGTKYENNWNIWVYPEITIPNNSDIVVTRSVRDAKQALKQGKKVLLNPKIEDLEGITGRFVPVFWSPVHFPDQPGTMGLLIDDTHPALADFPTSSHTDWNLWDLNIKSKSVILDSLNVKPIIRVVDNFVTNHKLANVFEAKVGNGSLVFTSIDLEQDLENRPVAKQLKYSLINYMNSSDFNPKSEISTEELKSLFK